MESRDLHPHRGFPIRRLASMRDLFSDLKGRDLRMRVLDVSETTAQAPKEPTNNNRPSHSPDFATVTWNDVSYTLTPKQRLIVAILWKAWEDGNRFVSGAYLLERADSD